MAWHGAPAVGAASSSSAAPGSTAGDDGPALAFMRMALPQCEPDFLRQALRDHRGDANSALEALLSSGPSTSSGSSDVLVVDDEEQLIPHAQALRAMQVDDEEQPIPHEQALRAMQAALPDCEEAHLREALEHHGGDADAALEAVASSTYPRKAKRPRLCRDSSKDTDVSAAPPPPPPPDLDSSVWFDIEKRQRPRTSPSTWHYENEALELLQQEFTELGVRGIAKVFKGCQSFYAPAWRQLQDAIGAMLEKRPLLASLTALRYPRKSQPPRDPKKLKSRILREEVLFLNNWKKLHGHSKLEEAREAYVAQCKAAKLLLECECCFGEYVPADMAQCSEGHLFCRACVERHVQLRIGSGEVHAISCPSISDCSEQLPPGELRRILPSSLWQSLQTRLQRSSIQQLLEEGGSAVEQCPFCNFVMIMDVPKELNKVFICRNEECEKESCRLCRQESHLPLRCSEVVKEKEQTDHRRAVEEKMSEALIRHCPHCKRRGVASAFLKESGCNKMTCPNKKCGGWFCYQCKAEIPKQVGYAHFCDHPLSPGQVCKCGKCSLWTSQDFEEKEERRAAQEGLRFHKEYLAEHSDQELGDLAVLEGAASGQLGAKAKTRARARVRT